MSEAVSQLQRALIKTPQSLELVGHARHISNECDYLYDMITPFHETLDEISSG